MEAIVIICLLAILSPLGVGVSICLWKFICEKSFKIERYFLLRKEEKQMQRNLKKYSDWYDEEQKAIMKACILNNRYERTNMFSLNDLKIWKAFI